MPDLFRPQTNAQQPFQPPARRERTSVTYGAQTPRVIVDQPNMPMMGGPKIDGDGQPPGTLAPPPPFRPQPPPQTFDWFQQPEPDRPYEI